MKKHLLFIALTLCALVAEAQTQKEQLCQVREQNSKRKPIANAQVIFEDAPAAVSQSDGMVRLLFQTLKAGEWTFKLDINRAGYELVNEKEVEKVKLSADGQFGVDIILARTGVVDSVKAIYYGVSNKSLKAGFEREKTKLRKERDAARLSAEQHAERLEQLNTEYENQKKNLDDLSEKFARVNFDDVDSVYQHALERFKAGEVKKAIDILEAIDPAKRTEKIIKEQQRIHTAKAELDAQQVALDKEKRQQIANLRLLADMYSATFDPAKAESQYDQLLRLDSTDLEILRDAANFYRNNHRYDKAIYANNLVITHPNVEQWQVAYSFSFLGETQIAIGELNLALESFTKCYRLIKELISSQPSLKSALAVSYSKLGEVYNSLGNLNYTLFFFEKFNRLEKELYEAYPQNVEFKNNLAISYSKLGETQSTLGNLEQALTFFEKDIELTKELYEAYPQNVSFKNGLAISYSQLGWFYEKSLKDNTKAREFYSKCLSLARALANDYPAYVDYQDRLKWVENALSRLE